MRSEKAIISTTSPVLMSAKTGWDYYTSEFNNIYRAINCNLFLSEYQYREIYKTVQGIHSYTRKFSGADGLQDFSLKQTKICITTHLHSARTENAVKII